MSRYAHTTASGSRARFGLPARLGAAIVAVLQVVLGVTVAIADAMPAAGHAAALSVPIEHGHSDHTLADGPAHSAPAHAVLSAGHPCPFCDYIASQQSRLFAVASLVSVPAVGRMAGPERGFAHEAAAPVPLASSRAPPLG